MGMEIHKDMPGHRREHDNANGKAHDKLYWQCNRWLEGEDVVV